ncbi:glycosyltransferase 87 family protein [Jejudonia soesokkakensis]|uniref:Glycosyltransferase 87 family protein n=1 Tax=Jejudonia soesokkakensis TaxID=1323432 RepID=A0ABW2MNQ0_9FLAO
MLEFLKTYKLYLFFAVLAMVFYGAFGYDLQRSDFVKLISLYGALFFIAYLLIEKWKLPFIWLAVLGIVFRLVFIVAIPNLSQDFYRFLWDGRLLVQRVNPYLFTPETYLNTTSWSVINSDILVAQAEALYHGMGNLNASHYSNYPPLNQLCFGIAAFFSGKSILGSVVVLRIIIILADIGILYFGKKLLEDLKLPVQNIFWYFLSPFIIIELTGNLHFEGVMLFFVVWSLYLLHKGKWFWAAVLLGLSVSVKLLPLLFLPLFFKYILKKEKKEIVISNEERNPIPRSFLYFDRRNATKTIAFYNVTLGTILLTFAPFLSSEFISNFSATIGLWFQNFEFNASVYYVIRWIGFQTVGWNIIGTVGKVLPLIVILILLVLTFFRRNSTTQQLITGILLGVSVYFLLSTTVHPWYIATPLVLSVFTKYRFPIVWSFVVMLSYTAYGADGFSENLWFVAFEYIVVIGFAIWELFYKRVGFKNKTLQEGAF